MILVTVIAGFGLGLLGAWLAANHATALGMIDVPVARSSHDRATPKGGGIGIAAAFAVAGWMGGAAIGLILPTIAIALLGLVSDRFEIKPQWRLVCHFFLAFCLLHFGLPLDHPVAPAVLVIMTVFLVGTANFYNFMDGINGIAAMSAIVAFGLLAWAGVSKGMDNGFVELCLGLAAASAGFLPFNLPTARVFMGDVGSLLLGFGFGSMLVWAASDLVDAIALAGFLLPFYVDECNTMVVRLRRGEKLWDAHRRHLYQVMANEAGLAHWKVTLGYAAVQLSGGGVMLALMMIDREAAAIASVIGFAILSVIYHLLYKHFASPTPPVTGPQTV